MASAWLFPDIRILIRGAGDLASGVAYRLYQAGFPVVMTELPRPLFVRRMVSYGNAIFEGGHFSVAGVRAVYAQDRIEKKAALDAGFISILIDPEGTSLQKIRPHVVVDARLQKRLLDTRLTDAPLVVGLGVGFAVGTDVHAVIETNRGHNLGRVLWAGQAEPNTGTPGQIAGFRAERVLRAPHAGFVKPAHAVRIGTSMKQDDLIATIDTTEIRAPFPGVLRGLIHPTVEVWKGVKIGDLDPRNKVENCFTISDKALAVGGGVVEAIMSSEVMRGYLRRDEAVINAPF